MRKPALFFILVLAVAPSAFAQRKNELSVFLSDISHVTEAFGKTHWYGGVGLAYNAFVTPRFSAQLAVAAEEHRSYPYIIDGLGGIQPVPSRKLRTYPIDLSGRYQFLNETRWKPYLGLGARYLAAPKADPGFGYRNRLTPEAVGGVEFLVLPS